MDGFFIIILIVVLIALAIKYFNKRTDKIEEKEEIRRELLLYREKCDAERTKQMARVAGEVARQKIDRIANRD